MNLISLFKKFPTEESCIIFLENVKWKNGATCPYCNSKKTCKHLHRHQCQSCHKSFSVTVGTIFHHTHLDLRNWFYIISLMLNAKKGLSAYQVARDLDMRRATAWKIMHKIRKAMQTEQKGLLEGIFEMDETYIKAYDEDKDDDDTFGSNMGRSLKNNTPVVAIKQKGGDIKAFATENTKYHVLGKIAMDFAEIGSEVSTY